MFQSFEKTSNPDTGPLRLAALRKVMAAQNVDAFLVPRADAHQGEYVAPRDDRLAWLTGFTGSAGWCAVLAGTAGVFVDGRYRVQVRQQVADVFTPVDWPETALGDWLAQHLDTGARIGFDPWLITPQQLRALEKALPGRALVRCDNLVDAIWEDQPAPPLGLVFEQPVSLAGEARDARLERIATELDAAQAAVLTLPDSLAWLLNIRGSDIPRNPVPHGFGVLTRGGQLDLFMAPEKLTQVDLGARVRCHDVEGFLPHLAGLTGPVVVDPATAPVAVLDALQAAGVEVMERDDPCILPKACKNAVEIEGARAAHLRDGAAMVRFLAWLEAQPANSLTEITVVQQLEAERRATNALRDISFETISGAGPNGAIVHYRVNEDSNRPIAQGDLLLVDSGGQYVDGTTDITRTVAIGPVTGEAPEAFTRVLKGMIAISRLRFPKGLAGRDIDPFARAALWEVGLDYGHGTGHGVGSYLSVHEGPARIAKTGTVPLAPGMILSNEPGFYREGAYGIRIENLIVVEDAPALRGQTVEQMLRFETLTYVPIDRRLIVPNLLTAAERDWLDAYHAQVLARIGPLVEESARAWLEKACTPL